MTIRLLDPPLHEFLPKREDLMVEVTKLELIRADRTHLEEKKRLLERVEELHEFNPMLGLRGCRLGIYHPEITRMQARAIFEAACEVTREGIRVQPEIMIPLVSMVREMRAQKEIVVAGGGGDDEAVQGEVPLSRGDDDRAAARRRDGGRDRDRGGLLLLRDERPHPDDVRVLPRRLGKVHPALHEPVGALPAVRDEAGEGSLLRRLQGDVQERPENILEDDVFATIDRAGSERSCGWASRRAVHPSEPESRDLRRARRGPEVGGILPQAGLDYVSCSPYRVPIARLAAAQAVLRERSRGKGEEKVAVNR